MNNNVIKKDSDTKKILAMIVMIATLMICTTSATYAYFAITPVSNASMTGTAATAGLTLAVNRIAPTSTKWTSSTQRMVPQLSTALSTAMGDTYSCVDGNTNVVCQVYEVTLTNTSTAQVKVSGTITFSGVTNMGNLKWRLYKSTTTKLTTAQAATNLGSATNTAITNGTAVSLDTNLTLKKTGVTGNIQYYYIVVWIDETSESQSDSGTYTATINFTSSDGAGITSTITS